MKKIIPFLFLCVLTVFCFGQDLKDIKDIKDLKEYGYVFSEFQKGIVRQKSGAAVEALLNYDMVGQQIQYRDGDKIYDLDPTNVLSVLVSKRKFVPAGNSSGIFYEEIPTVNGYFYVQHRVNAIQAAKNAGYGGTTQTTSSTNMANIDSGNRVYSLNSLEKKDIKDATSYYVEIGGKYRLIANVKNLAAIFKSNKVEIEKFAADNKTDFKKEADVAAIVDYAYSLNK